jgi:hypothetical protein
MSDSSNGQADRNRRLLLGTGGAALALAAADAGAATAKNVPKFSTSRTRYGTTAQDATEMAPGTTYLLQLGATAFTDGNTDTTLNADHTITINNAGLYHVALSVDWPGQHGVDGALRSYGIRRRKAALPPLATTTITQVVHNPDGTTDTFYLVSIDAGDVDQQLASQDIVGSSAPTTVRFPAPGTPAFNWTPGTIPLGGRASINVTLPVAGVVAPGDLVLASLTSINDPALGVAATTALIIDAKIVAPDVVRVTIFNPTVAAGVSIPQGQLNVVAMSQQNTVGESADAWTVLTSTTEQFYRGDTIYAVYSSGSAGDYMQTSDQVFVQLERWTQ